MIAGEFPVMTVPSARVTVPPLTIKSPAEALPSTMTLPPLTVQSTGATLASITTVPPLTVAPCTVALPLEEVSSSCTPLGTAIGVAGVVVAPARSSVTVSVLAGSGLVRSLMACTAVLTALLEVVWRVTEPPVPPCCELLRVVWRSVAVSGWTSSSKPPTSWI